MNKILKILIAISAMYGFIVIHNNNIDSSKVIDENIQNPIGDTTDKVRQDKHNTIEVSDSFLINDTIRVKSIKELILHPRPLTNPLMHCAPPCNFFPLLYKK